MFILSRVKIGNSFPLSSEETRNIFRKFNIKIYSNKLKRYIIIDRKKSGTISTKKCKSKNENKSKKYQIESLIIMK